MGAPYPPPGYRPLTEAPGQPVQMPTPSRSPVMESDAVLLGRLVAAHGYDPSSAGAMFRRMTETGGWSRYFYADGTGGPTTFGPSHYNFKSVRDGRGAWVPVRDREGNLIPDDGVVVRTSLAPEFAEVREALRVLAAEAAEPDQDCLADLRMLYAVGAHFGRPRVASSHVGLRLTCWGGWWSEVYSFDDGASGNVMFGPVPQSGFPVHVVEGLRGVEDDARRALTVIHASLCGPA